MKKITGFKLKLDSPITVEEANACLHILFEGVGCHFDEDGMQSFRPEAFKTVRKAFSNSLKKFGLEVVREEIRK